MRLFKRKKHLTEREFVKLATEWTVYEFTRDLIQYFHLDLYPEMGNLFKGMSEERRTKSIGELIILHIFGMLEQLWIANVPFEAQQEFRTNAMMLVAHDLPHDIDSMKLIELRFAQYRKIWAEDSHSGKLGLAVAGNIFNEEELAKHPAARLMAERAIMKAFTEYMKDARAMLDKYDLREFKKG